MKLFREKGFYLMLVGVAMMGLGLFREEVAVIVEEAIHICLECVGIG